MSDDRIKCVKCDKKIVPRLWRRHGTLFTNTTHEHLCPYCGTLQYETGGGITGIAKLLMWAAVAFLVLSALSRLFR